MKNLLVLLACSVVLLGCGNSNKGPAPKSDAEKLFGGIHKLRKMVSGSKSQYHASGGLFFLLGSYTADGKTETVIKFAWLMNDGKTYAISSLPLEQIRVQLTDKDVAPTIRFVWIDHKACLVCNWTLQYTIDKAMDYAVITCNEKDWPVNVEMPLNK